MKNYFILQIKRAAKQFPSVMVITLLLFGGLAVILYGLLATFFGGETTQRFSVAITGDTNDMYLRWGLSAVQSMDDSRFSLEILEMDEETAQKALEKGEISAYAVLPKGFMENAMTGVIEPITYVTAAGMEGITTVFKQEITQQVTEMVVYSQKGVYGMAEAMIANGTEEGIYDYMTELSLEFAELIFYRDTIYSVKELGISNGLSTPEYYVCAISLMLILLIGIPFAAINIKKDYAFCRLLRSRGHSAIKQIGCEYAVHLLTMLLQVGVLLLVAKLIMPFFSASREYFPKDMAGKMIPVVIMVAAWNMMLFELANNIVSGLLLHFFAVISLCYISGCIYPVYAFPTKIQELVAWLPTGVARGYLSTCFTFKDGGNSLIVMAGYTVLFIGVALWIRFRKTARIRG